MIRRRQLSRIQKVVVCWWLFHGCFLPAPRPIPVLKMCCTTVLSQMCCCRFAVSTIHCIKPSPPLPLASRKGLYPTLLSCFSHPAWAAATSLLARLPKHSLALTSRILTNTPHQHTHPVVPALASQGCLHRIQNSVAQSSRPQSSSARRPVICILSLAAT